MTTEVTEITEVSDVEVKSPEAKDAAGGAEHWPVALLCWAIIPLAFLLRWHALGAKSFDEDEILSVLMGRWTWGTFWWMATHVEANSALYFGTLRAWIHLGQSEAVIRSFSAILGLATVPVLYLLGTRAFGRLAGCVGAFLLAINVFHIHHSQNARGYTLLVFLVTLSSLLFLRSMRDDSPKNWILYTITSALAIYVHVFAVFVLMAHWISLLFARREHRHWKSLATSTAAIAFLALPIELFMMFRRGGQIDWISQTSWQGVYSLFAALAGSADVNSPLGYTAAALVQIYLILVVIGALALLKLRTESMDEETWNVAFFLTWLLVPLLMVLLISTRKPMLVNRYLIICLPPFLLLAAYGCSRLRKVWQVAAVLCLIAVLTAPGLFDYYEQPGQDWRGLAQYILSSEKPGDAAVFCPAYFGVRMTNYLGRMPYLERTGDSQSDAYPVLQTAFSPAKQAGASGSQVAMLDPADDNSFGPMLQGLSTRYDRVWYMEREGDGTGAVPSEQRFIKNTLAAEFPESSDEKHFAGNLVLVLYHKAAEQQQERAQQPKAPIVATASSTVQTTQQPKVESMVGTAKVHFTSSPTGGEIYVDGKFYGDTPSDITLPAGGRVVKVTILGKTWSRSIEITPGEISLHADLLAQ